MPKPIDRVPLLAPKYRESKTEHGWAVYVTPPAVIGTPTTVVYLNDDQYERYRQWRNDGGMIHKLLPELTSDQREQLLSGLLNDNFDRMTKEDDNGNA